MDLWLVNDTIRRSKMRDVPGASTVRGARFRERFDLGECRQREAVRWWRRTGWEGSPAAISPFGVDRMTARAIGAVRRLAPAGDHQAPA